MSFVLRIYHALYVSTFPPSPIMVQGLSLLGYLGLSQDPGSIPARVIHITNKTYYPYSALGPGNCWGTPLHRIQRNMIKSRGLLACYIPRTIHIRSLFHAIQRLPRCLLNFPAETDSSLRDIDRPKSAQLSWYWQLMGLGLTRVHRALVSYLGGTKI